MVEVHDVEAAAARAELGEAADHLAFAGGAVFAGHVEAQPVVPLVTDTEADEGGVLDVPLIDAPARRPHEGGVGLGVDEIGELLASDTDIAAQIPTAATILDRRLHARR